MKLQFLTLGCKANQCDTQSMQTLARERGHMICESDPDVLIINTCTVTGEADRKCRQTIRRARRENPSVLLCVGGCLAQINPDVVAELGADVIGGSGNRVEFLDAIERAYSERNTPLNCQEKHIFGERFEFLPGGGLEGRTRALLKVEDGCDNYCTYCIIPYSRGHVRSMPIDDAEREVRRLASAGFSECVITGIEISSYGRDLPGQPDLVTLTERLCRAAGNMRIHLGSLEPRTVDKRFCETLSGFDNLCPHFHPALQSGCDATLSRMKRKYTTARFLETMELLREYFPGCYLTTDLITGFPGETEEEFAETLDFLKKAAFGKAHIFPYSERRGTPAAGMQQIPKAVRAERARIAAGIASETAQAYLNAQIGKTLEVLFEDSDGEHWHGHAKNYVEVNAESKECLHNRILPVRITGVAGDGLCGIIE